MLPWYRLLTLTYLIEGRKSWSGNNVSCFMLSIVLCTIYYSLLFTTSRHHPLVSLVLLPLLPTLSSLNFIFSQFRRLPSFSLFPIPIFGPIYHTLGYRRITHWKPLITSFNKGKWNVVKYGKMSMSPTQSSSRSTPSSCLLPEVPKYTREKENWPLSGVLYVVCCLYSCVVI